MEHLSMTGEEALRLRQRRMLLAVAGLTMTEAVLYRALTGSEEGLLEAGEGALRASGWKERAIQAFLEARGQGRHLEEADRVRRLGGRAIFFGEPGYPARLEGIPSPPAVLFLQGRLPEEETPALAVVGSRRCTPEGRKLAWEYGAFAGRQAMAVVSGLARGIDAAAMEGCLHAGGCAVGVLGSGLDRIYPPEHRDLFEETRRQGVVVTEFPAGTPPLKRNFPRRNRLISGLADGLLVVEASERSGSLITVEHALEQDRPVMAVPGPVGTPFHKGVNTLVRDGACVVLEPADIGTVLNLPLRKDRGTRRTPPATDTGDPTDERLVEACRHRALTAEELARAVNHPVERVLERMACLELEGRVERVPGARFLCTPEN